MSERRRHPLNQSRLYMIKSPAQLSDVLQLSSKDSEVLLAAAENYIRFRTRDTGRDIQWPKPIMRRVHKRVATLLARIETPAFLHSAIKGRSYVTNASEHAVDQPTVKIDIRKFFQSIRAAAVYHFFADTLKCAGDVAAILTKLLTVDGHLPTGSSVSPILSYFAYEGMFKEIDALAGSHGCLMTCYIDDMAITGPSATRRMIYDVRQIVRRYRLWAHKTKIFAPRQPKVITGVAVTKAGRRLPNKRRRAIAEGLASLEAATSDHERLAIMRRLTSRMYEAAQIDSTWRVRAQGLLARMRAVERHLTNPEL